MTSPAPETHLPAPARGILAALREDPVAPRKVLVTGGFGTGKSMVLGALRDALRDGGRSVVSRPSPATAGAAVVVDDADLLDDEDIGRLVDVVADAASTVVVAAQPLAHRTALRTLTTALEREHPAVALGTLSPADVAGWAGPDLSRLLSAETGGLPFLVAAAVAAVRAADGESPGAAVRRAVRVALIQRLRRVDEPLLDTLLVSSLSPDLGPDDVAAALRVDPHEALALVDRARASGLIEPSHPPAFARTVHACIAQIAGTARHHDIELALLLSQLESATLSADLALGIAEHGLRDERLATALGELAGRATPVRAARLYRAAAEAGAAALTSQLADALALTGDCDAAGRLTDTLLSSADPAERAAAVRIAASIAAHDGATAAGADLFRWLGAYPDAVVGAAGAVVTLAAGDATAARRALDAPDTGPPTSTARAARSLADGMLRTLDADYTVAMGRLGQSITADPRAAVVMPDSPAALVTLAALHGGDSVRARSVIGRAVRAESDDAAFFAHRHRLLLSWALMQDGQFTTADAGATTLHRRDALWSAALATAVARRSGDTGALQKHWYAAVEVLTEFSVDLFSLLPLGELWVAAARMRQLPRVQHAVDEAFALLGELGDPPLWSVPLHWAGVHAGILANSPDAVTPHGQALAAAAGRSPFARVLATAGRTWLRVLANQVDAGEVAAAARGLAQYGHTWDATRLAGQAALQTADARVSQAMLQVARDLKAAVGGPDAPVAAAAGHTQETRVRPASSQLSDREREVAELLLLGKPYRDIGAQLYISAKTVEHHVARIRRRLGAESRSEMLSMLRAMLTPNS
jgi:DNA-binding CsgD family transcriptional regulator